MRNYQTAEEKAMQWDITANHVQYLCRKGKVEGAIKRAGAWFIPEDVPLPLTNTKSNVKGFKFFGTKKKIFDSAIELFMLKGFNDVSIRDIASKVGVRQSTLYNHFNSKQEILETIYDFYSYYYLIDRPDMEQMTELMRHGKLSEIFAGISYHFKGEYMEKMSSITKIIFQRVAIDERAREIAKTLMLESGMQYVEDVFKEGIEVGRFAPFDTHILSVFVNSIRFFTLFNWVVDSSQETMEKVIADEFKLYKYAMETLPQTQTQEPA